jgi:hypothetical protein
MKYILGWALIPLLVGCKSTIPSESISQQVISDLNAHQQAIITLDKQTSKECKTDAFVVSLNALKSQTESIAGQVKSITQACQTEKRVLEQKITIREIMIFVLLGILGIFIYLFIRKR